MNKLAKFLLGGVLAAGSVLSLQAQTIADWTFETSLPAGTNSGGVSYANIVPEIGSGSASGFHAGNSVYSTPAGNGSSHSFSSTGWAIGDYYQFSTSTVGYNDITLSFSQTSSGSGPGLFQLSYSTDGVSFTTVGAAYTVLDNGLAPNASWNATTANPVYGFSDDLSAITAIDNLSTVYFRLTDAATTSSSGGTVASGGTDRVDNFTIAQAPEPASIALAGIGGLALLVLQRRRS